MELVGLKPLVAVFSTAQLFNAFLTYFDVWILSIFFIRGLVGGGGTNTNCKISEDSLSEEKRKRGREVIRNERWWAGKFWGRRGGWRIGSSGAGVGDRTSTCERLIEVLS